MNRDLHERARELIAIGGGEDRSMEDRGAIKDQPWLRAHLQECAACRDYAESAGAAVRALRSQPMAADSALVRTTQLRVRSRALELSQQRERLWVICVCCAAVTLATAFTTAVLWRGFAWVGQQVQLPSPIWQIGLLMFSLTPAIVAGIILLARGTYLADPIGPLQY